MGNTVKCWCKHCGTELPPSHTGPCPKCGKRGKRCEASAHVTIGLVVSASARKIHEYTKEHPWFTLISILLTITSLTVGYLVGGLVGLLIGIIVAMLNWWLTPHARKIIVEITHLGNQEKKTQEVKEDNNTPPKKTIKDIYNKLEGIEQKIASSTRIQKATFFYALGVAFIILGLSYYALILEHTGAATTTFYRINFSGLLVLGTSVLVYASLSLKRGKEQKEAEQMGTKGRKNIKKPKKSKLEKMKAKKK